MLGREYFKSSLVGPGVAAVRASAGKVLAQQTDGIAPIATFGTEMPRGSLFIRAYPDRGRGNYIVMARMNGRDRWHRVALGEGAAPLLRAAASDGGLRGQLGPVTGNLGNFEIQRLSATSLNLRIRTPEGDVVEGPTTGDVPTGGGTQSLGFWGALVAIVALLVARDIVAMLTDNETGSWSLKMRGAGSEVEVEVTSADDLGGGDGDGFMHDPICDTMPPMNC